MKVYTLIKNVHFGMIPEANRIHFHARKPSPTRITGPRYTSQESTVTGQVIQREYQDRAEWAQHRAVISRKLSEYHRQHGKLKGCQCAYCASHS